MEQARRRKVSPPVNVFATDIDGDALDHARRGAYPQSALANLPAPLVDRYFTTEDGVRRARHALRERILFARHNLLSDPPFSRLDLVSCRNVLIYLNAGIQGRILQFFHYTLKEGGYLFLGASESPGRETGRFAVVDRVNRVYRRDGGTARAVPEFPLTSTGHAATRPAGPQADAMVTRRTEQVIAERFTPAWILVDDDLVVRDSARAEGRWMDAGAAGSAGAGVLERAKPAIRGTLATTLEEARRTGTRSRGDGPLMEVDGQQRRLSLIVEPLGGELPSDPPQYLVVFETGPAVSGTDRAGAGPAPPSPAAAVPGAEQRRLGTELEETRQRLQAAIEKLEATNEELNASNEELASINEELHAANEQIETSKEEIQSNNEEIQTVNTELNQRIEELAQANADQMNLFDNTNVAMLFIDRNMRIRNFTPPLADIFYVVEADKGRPVQHIAHRLDDQEVLARARQVLEGAGSDEHEVALRDGDEVFLLLIQPYRMLDGRTDGVVLSFTDVTRLKESERRLQESERRQRLLLRELQHRVKNMLASMRALVNRTYSDSTTLESFHEALQGRLEAMSRAQLLVGAAGGRSVDLKELFLEEFLALAVEVGRDAEVEGPDLLLAARAAETFALAIHELATNAVKFGALSVENGRVDVGWRLDRSDDVPILLLEWRERGVQLAGQPERRGFGHMMIERGLPYEMGGTSRLEFLDDGCRCVMKIPLADNFEPGKTGNGIGAGA